MTATLFDPVEAASLLLAARASGISVPWTRVLPADRAQAYSVQEATLLRLGPIGGWKVGGKGRDDEPIQAPLPASGFIPTGGTSNGPPARLRGIELELALRVARDFATAELEALEDDTFPIFDAVLPAIEIVETRLEAFAESPPLARLADLQSHGALVLGCPIEMPGAPLNLQSLKAKLSFDDNIVSENVGGNPAGDLRSLVSSLVKHCVGRGIALRAGQIVTTGSCTGMLLAPAETRVCGTLAGIGCVDVHVT